MSRIRTAGTDAGNPATNADPPAVQQVVDMALRGLTR